MPRGSRRRTPGLRRDEVAQLAGISTAWYTFLEQGRDIRVAPKTLDAIADVLRLTSGERNYLFTLAAAPAGPRSDGDASEPKAVIAKLQRILDHLDVCPAYVLNHRFAMVALNRAAAVVYDYALDWPERELNILWRLFTDPSRRRLQDDWERTARITVALFRKVYARRLGEPALMAMVEELQAQSADFRRLWTKHEVLGPEELQRTFSFHHPRLGELTGSYTFLGVSGHPDLTMFVLTPVDGTDTAEKIRRAL